MRNNRTLVYGINVNTLATECAPCALPQDPPPRCERRRCEPPLCPSGENTRCNKEGCIPSITRRLKSFCHLERRVLANERLVVPFVVVILPFALHTVVAAAAAVLTTIVIVVVEIFVATVVTAIVYFVAVLVGVATVTLFSLLAFCPVHLWV